MKEFLIENMPVYLYLQARYWDYRIYRNKQFLEAQAMREKETSSEPSYKPFDDTRSIFVHLPKCAGISVTETLYGNLAGGHTSIDHYVEIFEPRKYASYFKFTFVRNPWDRVVSAYHFLKSGGINKWDEDFYATELSQYPDFETFVLNWLNEDSIYLHHHFTPQHHYLFDRYYKTTVDYVGRVETIDKDFQEIARKIGVKSSLSKLNASGRQNYQDYYTTATRDRVAEVYAADASIFGYSFEGYSDQLRISPSSAKRQIQLKT